MDFIWNKIFPIYFAFIWKKCVYFHWINQCFPSKIPFLPHCCPISPDFSRFHLGNFNNLRFPVNFQRISPLRVWILSKFIRTLLALSKLNPLLGQTIFRFEKIPQAIITDMELHSTYCVCSVSESFQSSLPFYSSKICSVDCFTAQNAKGLPLFLNFGQNCSINILIQHFLPKLFKKLVKSLKQHFLTHFP